MLDKYRSLRQALGRLREAGRDPFAVRFDAVLSPTEAVLDGQPVLLLGTNNYLGLTFDPDCLDAAEAALRLEGTGTTGSRIANGSYGGHAALEERVARFLGRRDAMVFSTGYQANLGVLSALAGRDDHLILDADSHASIYDGARLAGAKVTRFRHNDPDDLRRRLRFLADQPGDKLVVVEGIYSMLGDVAPLREIAAAVQGTGAFLLVDEAHSLGVLGETGRGLVEEAGVAGAVDFVVGTFSKSLGSVGGFCASDHPDFALMRLVSRAYMFTASLPPSVVAGVSAAIDVVERRPELRRRLRDNAHRLHATLRGAGFSLGPDASPIVSLALPTIEAAVAFWGRLLDHGVYVNLALPPATPGGRPLLRTSVSAAHGTAQIDRAADTIIDIGRSMGVLAPDAAVA